MSSSAMSLTLPGSDIPWLLARACAGEWAYEPRWKSYIRHPSFNTRFEQVSRMFVVPDFRDRSVQVAVEIIRREARKMLANKEVKHFEVIPMRHDGYKTIPHRMCAEKGCNTCAGLGVVFAPDPGAVSMLMGWVAILRVAR